MPFIATQWLRLMCCCATLFSVVSNAQSFDYRLTPQKIAENVYVFVGRTEDFSTDNGGNIVNTGFIVTSDGVVLIDAGPSLRYGQQMRAAIATVTTKPVSKILITHAHPDHYIGAQAFTGVGVFAVPQTAINIKLSGSAYLDNMFRLLLEWMKGSLPNTADAIVVEARDGLALRVGDRTLRLISLTGHTRGDLAIFDETSGTLFAGDLVFLNRTPTTPHANVAEWLASLDVLQQIKFSALVPGHGAVHQNALGIAQTRSYLKWLDGFLSAAALRGADMSELITTPIPVEFATLAVFRDEFARSLAHLFPRYEKAALK
jgi:quinoprotein relay system zinc metallohydrolase 1